MVAQRVVSLTCSNTEIVCALGCADRLVAVDADSDHPAEVVAKLPRVGRDLHVDAELVAAHRPDLVLASLTVPGHEQVLERLRARDLPFIAPAPESLDDVYRDIRDIAARLGVTDRGEQLVASMQAEIDEAPAPRADTPRVLIQWWPKPVIAPGRRSWAHDLLHCAGAHNALGDREVISEPLTDEQVAALDPDVIVLAWCGVPFDKYRAQVVYDNPAFADTRAVREQRVVPIPEAWLGRPGPRLTEGHRALREAVAALPG